MNSFISDLRVVQERSHRNDMHHADGSDSEVDFLGGLGSLIAADATVDSSLKLPHDLALVPSPEALVQPPKPALQRCFEKTIPGQRTPTQHALFTCHMRARKATYKAREEKAKENQRVIEFANSLRHAALRVNALVFDRHKPNGAKYTSLCVHFGSGNEQSRLSAHAWMCITFEDGLVADKAMARRFGVSPKSIRNSMFLMASVILDSVGA